MKADINSATARRYFNIPKNVITAHDSNLKSIKKDIEEAMILFINDVKDGKNITISDLDLSVEEKRVMFNQINRYSDVLIQQKDGVANYSYATSKDILPIPMKYNLQFLNADGIKYLFKAARDYCGNNDELKEDICFIMNIIISSLVNGKDNIHIPTLATNLSMPMDVVLSTLYALETYKVISFKNNYDYISSITLNGKLKAKLSDIFASAQPDKRSSNINTEKSYTNNTPLNKYTTMDVTNVVDEYMNKLQCDAAVKEFIITNLDKIEHAYNWTYLDSIPFSQSIAYGIKNFIAKHPNISVRCSSKCIHRARYEYKYNNSEKAVKLFKTPTNLIQAILSLHPKTVNVLDAAWLLYGLYMHTDNSKKDAKIVSVTEYTLSSYMDDLTGKKDINALFNFLEHIGVINILGRPSTGRKKSYTVQLNYCADNLYKICVNDWLSRFETNLTITDDNAKALKLYNQLGYTVPKEDDLLKITELNNESFNDVLDKLHKQVDNQFTSLEAIICGSIGKFQHGSISGNDAMEQIKNAIEQSKNILIKEMVI